MWLCENLSFHFISALMAADKIWKIGTLKAQNSESKCQPPPMHYFKKCMIFKSSLMISGSDSRSWNSWDWQCWLTVPIFQPYSVSFSNNSLLCKRKGVTVSLFSPRFAQLGIGYTDPFTSETQVSLLVPQEYSQQTDIPRSWFYVSSILPLGLCKYLSLS